MQDSQSMRLMINTPEREPICDECHGELTENGDCEFCEKFEALNQ